MQRHLPARYVSGEGCFGRFGGCQGAQRRGGFEGQHVLGSVEVSVVLQAHSGECVGQAGGEAELDGHRSTLSRI